MDTGFALSQIDTTTPHPARMYDALLGGKDNYAADRQAVSCCALILTSPRNPRLSPVTDGLMGSPTATQPCR